MNWIKTINDAIEYMENHLRDEIALADIAEHVNLSAFHFQRAFSLLTEMSPAEYLRKKRLEKAALLLRSTDLDVQQIAMRLQFCSQSYFTDSFRKEFGVSPTKYRKEGKA
jgi:AraC family transcriptional regulator